MPRIYPCGERLDEKYDWNTLDSYLFFYFWSYRSPKIWTHAGLLNIQAKSTYALDSMLFQLPPPWPLSFSNTLTYYHSNTHLEEPLAHYYLPTRNIETKTICGCVASGIFFQKPLGVELPYCRHQDKLRRHSYPSKAYREAIQLGVAEMCKPKTVFISILTSPHLPWFETRDKSKVVLGHQKSLCRDWLLRGSLA